MSYSLMRYNSLGVILGMPERKAVQRLMTERQENPPQEQAEVKAKPPRSCQCGYNLLEVWVFFLSSSHSSRACSGTSLSAPAMPLLLHSFAITVPIKGNCAEPATQGGCEISARICPASLKHFCGIKFSTLLNMFIFFQHIE